MKIKRLIGLLLVTVLLFTMVPMSTLAKPADNDMSSTVKTSDISSDNPTSDESANDLASYVNGIVKCPDGRWAMYKNGKVDTTCTTIAMNQYGWWRVKDGYVDFNANGIYKNQFGWWKTNAGKVTFKETGIYKNEYGWWRVVNSKVDFKANGIYKNSYGWWKTTNGKVTFDETGVFKNQFGWWYVKDSKVDFTFTGIASNTFGKWYIKNGKVDFLKNGKVSFNGNTYLVIFGKAFFISGSSNDDNNNIDLEYIEKLSDDGAIEVTYDRDNTWVTIDGQISDKKILNSNDASKFLNTSSSLFSENFKCSSNEITAQDYNDDNEHIYKYTPTIDGIPVIGSSVILSTDSNGTITSLNNNYNKLTYDVDSNPHINEKRAKELAIDYCLEDVELSEFLNDSNTALIKESLINDVSIDSTLVIGGEKGSIPVLLYAVSFDGVVTINDDKVNISKIYYIHANDYKDERTTGLLFAAENADQTFEITAKDLSNNDRYCEVSEDGDFYVLRDSKRDIETQLINSDNMNIGVVSVNKQSLNLLSPSAVSLHANVEKVYDYYSIFLGRKSYNNKGKKIICIADDAASTSYACFNKLNKTLTVSSSGQFVSAVDVIAHEFTHGVFLYEVANGNFFSVLSSKEFGALNEAYADIMGNLVEGKTDDGNWLLGEDTDGIKYDMKSPASSGFKENYSDFYKGTDDDHLNSSIFSFAAYKMMTDSRCSSINKNTWAKVFYKSLRYLDVLSNFHSARGAVILSAKTLNFNDNQIEAIKDAFDAVGIKQYGKDNSISDSHFVGVVYNADNPKDTISGADVTVYKDEKIVDSSQTDLDGKFSFYLPAGTYSLIVTKSGYQKHSVSIKIEEDGYYFSKIHLKPNSSNAYITNFEFGTDRHVTPIPFSNYYVSSDGITDYYKYPKPVNYSYLDGGGAFYWLTYIVNYNKALVNDDNPRMRLDYLDNSNNVPFSGFSSKIENYWGRDMSFNTLGKWLRITWYFESSDGSIIKKICLDFITEVDSVTRLRSSEGTSLKVGSPTWLQVVNEVGEDYLYYFYAINEDTQEKTDILFRTYSRNVEWVPQKAGNYTLYVQIVWKHNGVNQRIIEIPNVTIRD